MAGSVSGSQVRAALGGCKSLGSNDGEEGSFWYIASPFCSSSSSGQLSPDAALSHMLSSSGKLQLLDRLMEKLLARGHRVLIYSQVK